VKIRVHFHDKEPVELPNVRMHTVYFQHASRAVPEVIIHFTDLREPVMCIPLTEVNLIVTLEDKM